MSGKDQSATLPWERGWGTVTSSLQTQPDTFHCGQYVLQTLLTEFNLQVERKITNVLKDSLNKELAKTLLAGDKDEFDMLLKCLTNVSEHALPSILTALFQWHDMQIKPIQEQRKSNKELSSVGETRGDNCRRSLPEEAEKLEKNELAVEFIFCLALIAVLPQLSVHPVSDDQVREIENLCFKNFKRKDFSQHNSRNGKDLTDLYAEVLGVLSEARFQSVIRKFKREINQAYYTTQTIINFINGMRFIKLKLYPIEALQASFEFMQELGEFFLDAKEKETRHSYAGLITALLVPVAAVINREVNVPVCRNFVDKLYQPSLQFSSRKAHAAHLYDMITILLSVSSKQFFLTNWPIFLQMCISGLKTRDLSKVSFNCIYRLVWVYVVRIKCEANTTTNQRLTQIIEAIFPRGSRNIIPREGVQPRDFIQLILIISLEKLDYVMREVVYDLLCVNNRKMITSIYPERMNIGLNAFLAIANHLEKKEGNPPMPGSNFSYPSETYKKKIVSWSNNSITDEIAESIGVGVYLIGVRKALERMLHNLQIALGHILQTNPTYANKNSDEILEGERKLKVQLLKTCVGAIPRIIPEGMQKTNLVDLISKLTIHMDKDLTSTAVETLKNMIRELPRWRLNVVGGYVTFLQNIPHNYPIVMDRALVHLASFITIWRDRLQQDGDTEKVNKDLFQTDEKFYQNISLIHKVEGMAIVMLCSCSYRTKNYAKHLLVEAQQLFNVMVKHFRQRGTYFEDPVWSKIEEISEGVIMKCLQVQHQTKIPKPYEIRTLKQFLDEDCLHADINCKEDGTRASLPMWLVIMFGMLHELVIKKKCASALYQAYLIGSARFQKLHPYVEASIADPGALSRTAGLGRSRRSVDKNDMCLWRNLMILCCKTVRSPSKFNKNSDMIQSHPQFSSMKDPPTTLSAMELYKRVVILLKNDNVDVQEIAVTALGASNPDVFSILVNCVDEHLGDTLSRSETVRRRRRREHLRLQVSRVYELCADNGCFKKDSIGDMGDTIESITHYIDHTKSICEEEKDSTILTDLKFRFCEFIRKMIVSSDSCGELNFESLAPVRRMELFRLFRQWCLNYDTESLSEKMEKTRIISKNASTLSTASLLAMCALLNAGSISENDLKHNNHEILIWVKHLIGSDDKYTHSLGCQVTEMLLLNNPEKPCIVNWVMNQCYIGTGMVPSGCFLALVRVLANCDYPCSLIPSIVVTLYMSAYNDTGVREKATYLLQLIVNRFFKEWRDNTHKLLKTDSHVMLSHQLSQQHKEITLPLFNEIMERLQQTSTCTQKILLQILSPWLANVELVEYPLTSSPPKHIKVKCTGSVHGSLLVFTNLMLITIQKNLEHEAELQNLWGNLMSYPGNPRVLLNYIITLASLGAVPHTTLPQMKKVVMYMCRFKPDDVITMLCSEVDKENIKPVSQLLEREDCQPYFYHISVLQKHEKEGQLQAGQDLTSEDEDPARSVSPPDMKDPVNSPYYRENHLLSRSSGDMQSQEDLNRVYQPKKIPNRWEVLLEEAEQKHYKENIPPYTIIADEEDDPTWAGDWVRRSHKRNFNPLPLPANGGSLGGLMQLLPPVGPDVQLFRCNLAIILLCDIVLDQSNYDWTPHLPRLLQICFLGFDHMKWLVHEHCKKLMLNLIYTFIEQTNPRLTRDKLLDAVNFPLAVDHSMLKDLTVLSEFSITSANAVIDTRVNIEHYAAKVVRKQSKQSRTSLNNQQAIYAQKYPSSPAVDLCHVTTSFGYHHGAMGGSSQEIENNSDDDSGSSHMSVEVGSSHPSEINDQVNIHGSRGSTPTEFIARKHGVEPEVLAERVRTVLKFMNSRDQRPLWNYEQITPHNLTVESVHLMHSFLNSVLAVFDALVDIELKKEFCKETLSWAVHCGQRHYAGRSFEIFRCLQTELTSEFLLEVLRRLMDHVCDVDDSQTGYVVECLLTLECNTLLLSERIHSELLPQFKSKTDTIKRRPIDTRRHSSWDVLPPGTKVTSKQHLLGGSTASDDVRGRSSSEHNNLRVKAYSLTSFRDSFPQLAIECLPQEFSLKELLTDDDLFVISRVFWCSLCLSESDLEHEFSFATRLMNSMLDCICVSDTYTENLLEKVLDDMSWSNFPGVVHLFLKGVPTLDLCEATLELLAKLIPLCRKKVFRGVDDTALPLIILSLLPRLIASYDSPDAFCCKVAEDISMICRDKEPLKDLGKVMQMYIEHSYPRNCQMWIGAVCKYINDAYIEHCPDFLVYLVNVLQNGPHDYHEAILKIVFQSIKHIFLNHHFIPIHNPRVLQVLAKHEFSTTHEDQQILKLIISHSSSISLPVDTANIDHYRASLGAFSLFEHGLPELPGRSIQFKVDFKSDSSQEGTMSSSTSQQSLANSTHNLVPSTNWRRPTVCFRKCRDRIASLLKISGDIEQTNSLVFSAASDCEISKDMYQSTSSSDSVSGMDISTPSVNVNHSSSIPSIPDDTSLAGALNQFDFLNDENTADEGNDTDSINSSWRGGLNASSYQTHSRDSSIDSLAALEKPRFKSLPHIERDELDTPMRRAASTMSPSRDVYPGKTQYNDDDMSTDSDLSDDGQNNTLKRPRSSASPHSRLYSKQKNKIEEHVDSSDTSSPDGPDSATPKLEYLDSSSSDIDEEPADVPLSPQAPDLFVLPPSPNYGNSVELQWLDSVSNLIRNTSEDLDCHVILIFQRIVKSHLLMLRESLTSSLDSLSPALPEEVLSVFNQCLSTFNILEVPFIFIDNVLLKQEYVKNKIQYHILESREKVEYLAKHQLATLRELRSLAGHSPSGPRNLSRQNLKTKRRITQVCVDVQALHFQFCSLYRTFSSVVDLVCELRKEEQVLDLSDYVSDLASRLFQAQMNPDIASLSSQSDKSLPRDVFSLDALPEQLTDTGISPGTSPRSTGSIPEVKHTKLSRSRTTSTESSRTQESTVSGPAPRAPDTSVGSGTSRSRKSSAAGGSESTQTVSTTAGTQTGSGTGTGTGTENNTEIIVTGTGTATSRSKHKDKKRTHRRGYSEANIEMFKSVQLEFSEIHKSSVSQHNLHINPAAVSPSSPPNAGDSPSLGDSESVNNIHLSQVDVRVENLANDPGFDEDTCSVLSEVPPPPTPGVDDVDELDFPLPPPPNEAYYTSPQIARREIERGIQHAPSTESIPEEEPEESLYTEMGELKLLSQLELEERRSRKGSSNEGSRHSRTSSTSGPHSTSLSSEDGCEVKIPVPGAAEQDHNSDLTLTNSTLQLSPSNRTLLGTSPSIYTGIMSSLTASQCIVFINDHMNAVADTAAIETLHQARARFGAFYFGSNESEDTLTLVGIFCQHGTTPGTNPGTAGRVALWGTTCQDLVKTTLMTNTLHLENAIKSFT
ncbi:hypothetical protein ACHWQZ_G018834 [Mnemiopsis leidyi]